MITDILVEDQQNDLLAFPLWNPTTGFVIREVRGLDPVKAVITTSDFANINGSKFQSSRRESRNIVMTIGLDIYIGYTTVAERRSMLYKLFMPETKVKMTFKDGTKTLGTIEGIVETCEASIFSKDPEVVVSILCPDPDFIGPDEVTHSGNTTSGSSELLVTNSGTVDAGYIFKLLVNRTVSTGFTLYNRNPGGEISMLEVNEAFVSGDVVTISTLPRNKYIRRTRGGVVKSILYSIGQGSEWETLKAGNNHIRVLTPGVGIPYSIEYTPRFGGL